MEATVAGFMRGGAKRDGVAGLAAGRSSPVKELLAKANAARDAGDVAVAAELYGEVVRLDPSRGPIHVQAGHMYKEAGDYDAAERHYGEAARLMPDDADLALQLGHFYKLTARPRNAHDSYARAVRLAPGWPVAAAELEALRLTGWRGLEAVAPVSAFGAVLRAEDIAPDGEYDELKVASLYGKLAPELLPRTTEQFLRYAEEAMHVRQFGVGQSTYWGYKPVARGIEAIRGIVTSRLPVVELQARVNGLLVHRGPLKGPYEMEYEPDKSRMHKYVFNIWYDFSQFADGNYDLELTAKVVGGPDRILHQSFVVERPLLAEDYPDSDAVVTLPPGEGSLEERINALPTAVHEAWRPNQIGEVRSIMVARSDQLGDMVATIPGVERLRQIFPEAKIVGVLGPANHEFARTLNLFDDIIVLDQAENWHQRMRLLTLEQQIEFSNKCAEYKFDIAIDTSQSEMSRPLLTLSGARFTYGFRQSGWDRLSSSYEDLLFDPKNRRENATHSKRVVNLMERLHTATHETGRVMRRDDLPRSTLETLGLGSEERFAVLHAGARIVWSRWKHFIDLALRMLAETDLKIVFFAADAKQKKECEERLPSDRVILIDGLLSFDQFDALLSYASVFVGNDSGPKHLASLRGTPVVSIHAGRINWSEWGQELTGVVMTRRVPCAGCHIYHDPEECGKDYACMNIRLDEVYEVVRRYV
jgi:ADP-heptose:LPS heptosyltransferase/tetratricopeptide (TPR) repeat protein